MKTTIMAGVMVLLALWFAYNRGYHHGVQKERRAWESTARWEQSPPTLHDDRPRLHVLYTNPHHGMVMVQAHGVSSKNVPDPRNLPF
jgi:hypothetical protein